jgi:mono/diheme cytochrome c family protein
MKNLIVVFLFATVLLAQSVGKNTQVTPVAGDSWLNHLHRPLAETSMGKTGRLGPLTPTTATDHLAGQQQLLADSTKKTGVLRGADLYRLNCWACHGESGLGAPPEINSVINPTRATSVALTMQKMQKIGMDMSQTDAAELANQSKAALLQRLHNGGTDMPPFPHLSEAEVRAIFAYLKQLADVPGAGRNQAVVEESPVRVGEHIVKSTCHICHSASGPNPNPDQLLSGTIPPLNTLTTRTTLPEFERKVRSGTPIVMGTPPSPYRGRMPVFYYLSESEVADAYLYLKLYPPYEWAVLDGVAPAPEQNRAAADKAAPFVPDSEPPKTPPIKAGDMKIAALATVAEIFVGLLLAGGLVFTGYEVKRLSARSAGKASAIKGASIPPNATASASGKLQSRRDKLEQIFVSDDVASDVSNEEHESAVSRSPFHHNDHREFESSWLSRRFEGEDWAA